jgi:hypothetical protein
VVGAVFLSKETCIKIPKGKNVLSHLDINDNSKEIMESFYLFTFLLDILEMKKWHRYSVKFFQGYPLKLGHFSYNSSFYQNQNDFIKKFDS